MKKEIVKTLLQLLKLQVILDDMVEKLFQNGLEDTREYKDTLKKCNAVDDLYMLLSSDNAVMVEESYES